MADLLHDLTDAPEPVFVMAGEGERIATYSWGDPDEPTVLCVHGFASSCRDNWLATGWVRELRHAGFRVLGVDQRGHGASDKPHEPRAYTTRALVGDLIAVLDTYLLDVVDYVGYSLGARVGWQFAADQPDRVARAVLGGTPDGRPLQRLCVAEARAYIADGSPVQDDTTKAYIALAERIPHNDLSALVALSEGLSDSLDPDPAHPPLQPILFATGSDDPILDRSRALAGAAPRGEFVEIPGRHHFNAPGSRVFRDAAVSFLG